MVTFSWLTLGAIPKFYLISWCESFVETHNFRRISGGSPKKIKVSKENMRTRSEICSKLTIKTAERSQWCC